MCWFMQFLICSSIWPFYGCSFCWCSVCVVRFVWWVVPWPSCLSCSSLCNGIPSFPGIDPRELKTASLPGLPEEFHGSAKHTSHWPGHSGQLGLSRGRVRKTECQLKCRECQEESVWCVMCDDKHDKHDKHDDVSQDDEVESVEGTEYVLMWTDCYRWG